MRNCISDNLKSKLINHLPYFNISEENILEAILELGVISTGTNIDKETIVNLLDSTYEFYKVDDIREELDEKELKFIDKFDKNNFIEHHLRFYNSLIKSKKYLKTNETDDITEEEPSLVSLENIIDKYYGGDIKEAKDGITKLSRDLVKLLYYDESSSSVIINEDLDLLHPIRKRFAITKRIEEYLSNNNIDKDVFDDIVTSVFSEYIIMTRLGNKTYYDRNDSSVLLEQNWNDSIINSDDVIPKIFRFYISNLTSESNGEVFNYNYNNLVALAAKAMKFPGSSLEDKMRNYGNSISSTVDGKTILSFANHLEGLKKKSKDNLDFYNFLVFSLQAQRKVEYDWLDISSEIDENLAEAGIIEKNIKVDSKSSTQDSFKYDLNLIVKNSEPYQLTYVKSKDYLKGKEDDRIKILSTLNKNLSLGLSLNEIKFIVKNSDPLRIASFIEGVFKYHQNGNLPVSDINYLGDIIDKYRVENAKSTFSSPLGIKVASKMLKNVINSIQELVNRIPVDSFYNKYKKDLQSIKYSIKHAVINNSKGNGKKIKSLTSNELALTDLLLYFKALQDPYNENRMVPLGYAVTSDKVNPPLIYLPILNENKERIKYAEKTIELLKDQALNLKQNIIKNYSTLFNELKVEYNFSNDLKQISQEIKRVVSTLPKNKIDEALLSINYERAINNEKLLEFTTFLHTDGKGSNYAISDDLINWIETYQNRDEVIKILTLAKNDFLSYVNPLLSQLKVLTGIDESTLKSELENYFRIWIYGSNLTLPFTQGLSIQYKSDPKAKTFLEKEAYRWVAQIKRNVGIQSTIVPPVQGLKGGVENIIYSAIVVDPMVSLETVVGKSKAQEATDGAELILPTLTKKFNKSFASSIGSIESGQNAKFIQMHHDLEVGKFELHKSAQFGLQNSRIRRSIVDSTYGTTSTFDLRGIVEKMLNTPMSFIPADHRVEYTLPRSVYHRIGDTLNFKMIKKMKLIIENNEAKAVLGENIFPLGKVNTLFDVYMLFGGWNSLDGNGNYDESSWELFYDFEVNSKTTTPNDSSPKIGLYKGKYISRLSFLSTVKTGGANVNSTSKLYNNEPLLFSESNTEYYGLQLNHEKEADDNEITEPTQVISSAIHGGMMSSTSLKIYEAIKKLTLLKLNKLSEKSKYDFMIELLKDSVKNQDLNSLAKLIMSKDKPSLDNPQVFKKMVSIINAWVSRNIIRNKYQGLGAILSPSTTTLYDVPILENEKLKKDKYGRPMFKVVTGNEFEKYKDIFDSLSNEEKQLVLDYNGMKPRRLRESNTEFVINNEIFNLKQVKINQMLFALENYKDLNKSKSPQEHLEFFIKKRNEIDLNVTNIQDRIKNEIEYGRVTSLIELLNRNSWYSDDEIDSMYMNFNSLNQKLLESLQDKKPVTIELLNKNITGVATDIIHKPAELGVPKLYKTKLGIKDNISFDEINFNYFFNQLKDSDIKVSRMFIAKELVKNDYSLTTEDLKKMRALFNSGAFSYEGEVVNKTFEEMLPLIEKAYLKNFKNIDFSKRKTDIQKLIKSMENDEVYKENLKRLYPNISNIDQFFKLAKKFDETVVYDTTDLTLKKADMSIIDEIKTFMANEQLANFKMSNQLIVARIPSQSLQSWMGTESVFFIENEMNTIEQPEMMMYLQGADLDIDKGNIIGYEFDEYGQLIKWNDKIDVTKPETFTDDLSENISEEGLKNYIVWKLNQLINNPKNMMIRELPIEMDKPRTIGETSSKAKDVAKMSKFNPSSSYEMFFSNMLGKAGIGIVATSIKAYSSILITVANSIKNNQNLDQIIKPLVLDGVTYPFVANAPMRELATQISNVNNFTKLVNQYVLIYENDRELQELHALFITNPKEYKNQLFDYIKTKVDIEYPAFDLLSQLLSAATDNAKELILGTLNATTETLGMYTYGIIRGVPLEKLNEIINDEYMIEVYKRFSQNIFDLNFSASIKNVFHMIEGVSLNGEPLFSNGKLKIPSSFKSQDAKKYSYYTSSGKIKIPKVTVVKKLHEIIRNNHDYEKLKRWKTLYDQANIFRSLGQILSINQGLPTTDSAMYNFLHRLQILNEYGDFNIREMIKAISNDNKVLTQKYVKEGLKLPINIPYVLSTNPSFTSLLTVFIDTIENYERETNTFRAYKKVLDYIDDNDLDTIINEDLFKKIKFFVDEITIASFLNDKVVNGFALSSVEGRQEFILNFPKYVESLKTSYPDNEFVQDLIIIDKKQGYVKLKTDLSNANILTNGFKIAAYRKSIKELSNSDQNIVFLYNLIYHKNSLRPDAFTKLLTSDQGLLDYLDFEANFKLELDDIDLGVFFTFYSITPYISYGGQIDKQNIKELKVNNSIKVLNKLLKDFDKNININCK